MLPFGLSPDIPEHVYHADPDTISSSGLRQILECPAKWRYGERKESAELNIGKAAHQMLSDPEGFSKSFLVLDPDHNGRTSAGQAVIAEARERKMIPIKASDALRVEAMADALMDNPIAEASFAPGSGIWEPTLVWQDLETGVRLRARPDWLPHARAQIPDYKTTVSAKPDDFSRAIANYGYHQQAALYCDGIEAVTGEAPKNFYFIAQEKEPPFVVSVIALSREALEWGRIMNARAIEVYARCLDADHWPGYTDDEVVTADLPIWFSRKLEDRHARGEFETTPRHHWQAPDGR